MIGQIVARRFFCTSRVLRGQTDPHKIGMREVVGHGMNGQSSYVDTPMFPYPAIRFREITPVYKALKEKEKGDWRSLCLEEKKTLYRISFCQTLSECTAPSGEWKVVIGSVLAFVSLGMMLGIVVRLLTDAPELPPNFKEHRQLAVLKRLIAFRVNPIDGIASKWDYDKGTWK